MRALFISRCLSIIYEKVPSIKGGTFIYIMCYILALYDAEGDTVDGDNIDAGA